MCVGVEKGERERGVEGGGGGWVRRQTMGIEKLCRVYKEKYRRVYIGGAFRGCTRECDRESIY